MGDVSLSERLGAFAASVDFGRLPAAVQQRTRELLWHQLGISLASHDVTMAGAAAASVRDEHAGQRAATILHGGRRAPATAAAFANAALFHVRVEDDAHRTAHLGSTVIAAALAVAESRHGNGADLLAGIIAGYEIGGALNRRFGAESTQRGFRATGLYGVLGAAAAAARVIGLDAEATAHAIGLAATFAGGLVEPFGAGSEDFPLQNGMAARNGVHAALLAEAGVRSARGVLEGGAGFLAAFAGSTAGADAADELGEQFSVLEVNLKPLPVCAGNQVPVMNARRVRAQLGDHREIDAVEIRMNPFEANHPGIDNTGPFSTRTHTLMSTQFCVALALTSSAITLSDLERYDDPEVGALVARSRVVAEPDLELLESVIRITTHEGRVVEERLRVPDEVWHPDFSRITARIHVLVEESGVDGAQVEDLARAIGDLDVASSVDAVVRSAAVRPR